jgi:hypothetical protein
VGQYRVISDWTPANHPIESDWQSVELNLDTLRVYNKIHLAFQYSGRDADPWAIDDIQYYLIAQNIKTPHSHQTHHLLLD